MSSLEAVFSESVQSFLDTLEPHRHPFLDSFRAEAEQNGVPVLSRDAF